MSVAFSADNRQIVSGSRDKTIKLWNTLGVCKYTIQVSSAELCTASLLLTLHRRTVILIGSVASDFLPMLRTLSSCHLDGIK